MATSPAGTKKQQGEDTERLVRHMSRIPELASRNGRHPKTENGPLATLRKFRMVIRAAQRHSQWVERQCGISGAQLWALEELATAGAGLRVGELAQLMSLHQATTSNLVEKLLANGYVSKVRDATDQRAVRVLPTEAGLMVLRRAPKPARGLIPEALRQLPEQERLQLDAGLDSLIAVISQLDEEFALLPLPFSE